MAITREQYLKYQKTLKNLLKKLAEKRSRIQALSQRIQHFKKKSRLYQQLVEKIDYYSNHTKIEKYKFEYSVSRMLYASPYVEKRCIPDIRSDYNECKESYEEAVIKKKEIQKLLKDYEDSQNPSEYFSEGDLSKLFDEFEIKGEKNSSEIIIQSPFESSSEGFFYQFYEIFLENFHLIIMYGIFIPMFYFIFKKAKTFLKIQKSKKNHDS